MAQILYRSGEVRNAVVDLFTRSKSRRVAISAFVGEGADAYLPKPKSLELICWPKPGGTNPNAIRKLIKKGIKVRFADSLHMKVYWTADMGAVITSANLSTQALGSGNLREIGIRLPAGVLDIDHVIATIRPYKVTKARLLKLDHEHKLYAARNAGFIRTSKADTWADWYGLEPRSHWKLGWYDGWGITAKIAKELSKREHGISDPFDMLPGRRGDYSKGDWVLTFFLKEKSSQLRWLYVDYYVRVPKSDAKAYDSNWPFQAVQALDTKKYSAPPFQINREFRTAFAKTVEQYGADNLKGWKSVNPSKKLVELINEYYKKA